MRVSKETAILLKEAGYDVPCNLVPNSCIVDDNGNILYLPTLHEAADWLRSQGVHVVAIPASPEMNSILWIDCIFTKDIDGYWNHKVSGLGVYQSHDTAYEAGIVHGLKY